MFLGEAPRDPSLAQPPAQARFLPQGILPSLKCEPPDPQIPAWVGHSGMGVVCGRGSIGRGFATANSRSGSSGYLPAASPPGRLIFRFQINN